jgi:hypothetical protein
MPIVTGYIKTSLTPNNTFTTCLVALKNSRFKYVDAFDSELIAKYKTSSSLTNNSWGEKIKIVVTEDQNNGSTLIVSSENLGGKESLHESNVDDILYLFQSQAKKQKDVSFRESGLIPASKIAASATTASWFVIKTESEDGEPDSNSGFNFFS